MVPSQLNSCLKFINPGTLSHYITLSCPINSRWMSGCPMKSCPSGAPASWKRSLSPPSPGKKRHRDLFAGHGERGLTMENIWISPSVNGGLTSKLGNFRIPNKICGVYHPANHFNKRYGKSTIYKYFPKDSMGFTYVDQGTGFTYRWFTRENPGVCPINGEIHRFSRGSSPVQAMASNALPWSPPWSYMGIIGIPISSLDWWPSINTEHGVIVLPTSKTYQHLSTDWQLPYISCGRYSRYSAWKVPQLRYLWPLMNSRIGTTWLIFKPKPLNLGCNLAGVMAVMTCSNWSHDPCNKGSTQPSSASGPLQHGAAFGFVHEPAALINLL